MGNLAKYTIAPDSVESLRILECWTWLLGSTPWRPVVYSMFGDCFVAGPDGRVYFLNLLKGELNEVAGNRADFERLAEEEAAGRKWFMGPLVDQVQQNGIGRSKGQIYGFKKLPLHGGAMTWENVEATNPVVYHNTISQVHQQKRDLPTEIRVARINPGRSRTASRRKWWQFWK